jgi:hypothetical protein
MGKRWRLMLQVVLYWLGDLLMVQGNLYRRMGVWIMRKGEEVEEVGWRMEHQTVRACPRCGVQIYNGEALCMICRYCQDLNAR